MGFFEKFFGAKDTAAAADKEMKTKLKESLQRGKSEEERMADTQSAMEAGSIKRTEDAKAKEALASQMQKSNEALKSKMAQEDAAKMEEARQNIEESDNEKAA